MSNTNMTITAEDAIMPGDEPAAEEAAVEAPAEAEAEAPAVEEAPEVNRDEEDGFLGGRFKNKEAMERGYTSLQSSADKLRRELRELKSGDTKEEVKSDEAPAESAADVAAEAEQKVNEAGLSFDSYMEYYDEQGALLDSHYEELADAGFSKDMVDTYIKGTKALYEAEYAEVEKQQDAVLEEIGGKEKFEEFSTWAQSNLSEADINGLNEAFASGNYASMRLALRALAAPFNEGQTKEPNRMVSGGSSAPTGTAGFESPAEMNKALGDPRYQSDAEFTKQVDARLMKTPWL